MGERMALTTSDRHLWTVADPVGLEAYPADLPNLLKM
jgi:hypothetical protein